MRYKEIVIGAVFLLICLGGLHAQQAVTVSGGDASGSGGSSSYSVGQVAYTTNTGSNGSVAQGVQQPYEISTTTGIEVADINLSLSAYPNPTIHSLTLDIGNYQDEELSYQVYSMKGELLEGKAVQEKTTIIGMENLPRAIYFLKVSGDNQIIKTFKIIKN